MAGLTKTYYRRILGGKSPFSFFFFLGLVFLGAAAKGSPLRRLPFGLLMVGRLPPLPLLGLLMGEPPPVPPSFLGPLTVGKLLVVQAVKNTASSIANITRINIGLRYTMAWYGLAICSYNLTQGKLNTGI